MSTKKDVHVVPHGDQWATRSEGAGRVGSVHDTQADAIDRAREQAQRTGSEVVIHRPNGQIRDSDSYGNESQVKDKKH
jgi:hypothetical protein